MDLCDNGSGGSLPQGFGIGHVRQYAPSASPYGAYRRNHSDTNPCTPGKPITIGQIGRIRRIGRITEGGGGSYNGDNFQRELKICLRPVLRVPRTQGALGGWCPDPSHTPVRRRSISQCSLWSRRDSSLPETLRDSADGLSSCRVLAPLVIIESVLPIRFSAMRGANSDSKVKGAGKGYLCETPHFSNNLS